MSTENLNTNPRSCFTFIQIVALFPLWRLLQQQLNFHIHRLYYCDIWQLKHKQMVSITFIIIQQQFLLLLPCFSWQKRHVAILKNISTKNSQQKNQNKRIHTKIYESPPLIPGKFYLHPLYFKHIYITTIFNNFNRTPLKWLHAPITQIWIVYSIHWSRFSPFPIWQNYSVLEQPVT